MLYGISGGSDVTRVGGRAGTSSLRVQMGESMRQYIPVITLALLSACPRLVWESCSLRTTWSSRPILTFDTIRCFRYLAHGVPENTPPGVNIGDPISATDADEDGENNDAIEFGDTLTYSLSGTDAASFDIDPSTGQLITKAPLDEETEENYSVTVTVKDGESGNQRHAGRDDHGHGRSDELRARRRADGGVGAGYDPSMQRKNRPRA